MSLLSSLPEREEKEKRVTSGLRNCVLYPSILSPVSESASFVNSFVLFFAFLVWMVAERIGRGEELNPKFLTVFLGKNLPTKSDDFLEKFQTALEPPPPHYWKIILQIFYNGYGCIYTRRYEGQMV